MMDNETGAEVDQLILDHLADLEQAILHVREKMEVSFWKAFSELLEKRRASFGWEGMTDDAGSGDFWITPPGWMTPDVQKESRGEDAWFSIKQAFGPNYRSDVTDLAGFIGASTDGNRWMLIFEQQVLGKRQYKAVLNEDAAVLDELRQHGFEIDVREARIALPLVLDAQAMGQGFVERDLEGVLQPVAAALDAAQTATSVFDRLVSALRSKG